MRQRGEVKRRHASRAGAVPGKDDITSATLDTRYVESSTMMAALIGMLVRGRDLKSVVVVEPFAVVMRARSFSTLARPDQIDDNNNNYNDFILHRNNHHGKSCTPEPDVTLPGDNQISFVDYYYGHPWDGHY